MATATLRPGPCGAARSCWVLAALRVGAQRRRTAGPPSASATGWRSVLPLQSPVRPRVTLSWAAVDQRPWAGVGRALRRWASPEIPSQTLAPLLSPQASTVYLARVHSTIARSSASSSDDSAQGAEDLFGEPTAGPRSSARSGPAAKAAVQLTGRPQPRARTAWVPPAAPASHLQGGAPKESDAGHSTPADGPQATMTGGAGTVSTGPSHESPLEPSPGPDAAQQAHRSASQTVPEPAPSDASAGSEPPASPSGGVAAAGADGDGAAPDGSARRIRDRWEPEVGL